MYNNYVRACVCQYKTLDDVMSDVELLVSNAMTFNEEDSTVYQVNSVCMHTHTCACEWVSVSVCACE